MATDLYVAYGGYRFRFRIRNIKNKRRDRKGKVRGRYEGKFVYVEIKEALRRTKRRDQYIGPMLSNEYELSWAKQEDTPRTGEKRTGKTYGYKAQMRAAVRAAREKLAF